MTRLTPSHSSAGSLWTLVPTWRESPQPEIRAAAEVLQQCLERLAWRCPCGVTVPLLLENCPMCAMDRGHVVVGVARQVAALRKSLQENVDAHDGDDYVLNDGARAQAQMIVAKLDALLSAPAPSGWQPMGARLETSRIVIEIGSDTLRVAAEGSPWANPYDENARDFIRTFRVTDAEMFAREVVAAMREEREDGSSLLTDLFDKACEAALEAGAEGCEYDQHIPLVIPAPPVSAPPKEK